MSAAGKWPGQVLGTMRNPGREGRQEAGAERHGSAKLAVIRRISQIVFFALFMFLLLKSEFRGSLKGAAGAQIPYPIRWFLEIDPLSAVINALATRSLYRGLLWSLIILIPTFILGRFFCGWVCPFGTLNHYFGSIRSESKLGKRRIESNQYKRWQTLKYYILIAGLVAALFGGAVLGLMDPISLTVRSIGTSILPGINYAANATLDAMYRSHIGVLQVAADVLRYVGEATILSFKQTYFRQGFLMGLIFVIILALNLRITRFWCRALCPLGALLGVVSRWSIFGLVKNPSKCDSCKRCSMYCQGGDDPMPGTKWRKSECHECFNCVGECPKGALEYKFFPGVSETAETPNLMRRRTLTGAAAGVALLPILRSTTALKPEHDSRLLRPPGSLEEKDFLARCVRCGECMKVCPNNALHPALTEAGVEGLWTPVVVPHIGYCEPTCVLCGQACPVGAIWELTPKEKGWVIGTATDAKPVRIGTAFYDRSRCLPWAMATDCIVCEEWCPTSPKAIYLRPAEVVDAQGNVKQLRQPWVNPERCVGCGACEHACPVQDQPAVHVTSIGESRSSTNQFLLKRNRESVRS